MKKNLFFAALAITALVSCSENDYLGDERPSPVSSSDEVAIEFGTGIKKTTRAEWTGADAAEKLNNNFVFLGSKTASSTTSIVFDQYNANWTQNTANTTQSNSNDWEYVGYSPASTSSLPSGVIQSIKYWDYATSQYDFAAYSLGKGVDDDDDDSTPNVYATATAISGQTKSFTLTGSAEKLKACYISDLVTYYNKQAVAADNTDPEHPIAESPAANDYGKVVTLSFRSLAAKIRIAFYETIPGYSVKDVQFYSTATGGSAGNTPTLFTSDAVLPSGSGTMTITYPTTGWDNRNQTDYNKAHIAFTATNDQTDLASTLTFGVLTNYPTDYEGKLSTGSFIGRTSNTATYADGETTTGEPAVTTPNAKGTYYPILPYETGANLQLRIKYTLQSIDAGGETITVDNATAVVPAELARWNPNYAYTYIFKISDMTNGSTGVDGNGDIVTGLTPITLDAVVVDSEEGVQETITTVSDPSITTYMLGKVITDNDEYIVNGDHPIYIVVNNGTSNQTLTNNTNAKLYEVSISSSPASLNSISEEAVDNALRYGVISGSTYTVTDANSGTLTVTDVTTSKLTGGVTAIAADDSPTGNSISVACATFVPVSGKVYAFQYLVDAGTPAVFEPVESVTTLTDGETYYTKTGNDYTALTADGTETIDGSYYTIGTQDAQEVTTTLTQGETYYTKSGNGYIAHVAEGDEDINSTTYYTVNPQVVESVTKLTAGQTYYTSERGAGKFVASGSEVIAQDKYWVMTNPTTFVPAKYQYKIIKVQ
jgi:hypothetical protein